MDYYANTFHVIHTPYICSVTAKNCDLLERGYVAVVKHLTNPPCTSQLLSVGQKGMPLWKKLNIQREKARKPRCFVHLWCQRPSESGIDLGVGDVVTSGNILENKRRLHEKRIAFD